jgi:hypothetical protein
MHAVERAADVRTSLLNSDEGKETTEHVVKTNVPVQVLFREGFCNTFDTPIAFNADPPVLGDRVVNLVATGVPFGLRGTVITIHSNTGYVEVTLNPTLTIFFHADTRIRSGFV